MNYDSVLLIAYGGPERFEDVRPFLANVLRGRRVSPERIETVVQQYRTIGGSSPLNAITFRQAAALQIELGRKKPRLKVYVGMRNWSPTLADTLSLMKREGKRRSLGIVLAPHRCEASWERYLEAVSEAQEAAGPGAPEIDFSAPWHVNPLFIEAAAARVRETLRLFPEAAESPWIFTAHSIPVPMDEASGYSRQIRESAAYIAARFSKEDYLLAYQSRSGLPQDPWLEPDISDSIRALALGKTKSVLVVPVGFVADHVEVLYDLDIKAKKSAEELRLRFFRAGTVGHHPQFIRMLAQIASSQSVVPSR